MSEYQRALDDVLRAINRFKRDDYTPGAIFRTELRTLLRALGSKEGEKEEEG